jgi:hypothetical protein
MGKYNVKDSDFKKVKIGEKYYTILSKTKWNEFNSDILGLGNIGEDSEVVGAIAAIFDLEGFTNFCKQIDPQLSTPIFLNQFLNWFFKKIKQETLQSEQEEGIQTWHNLPILTKFLGDGILVIWNTDQISKQAQLNIILSCQTICKTYNSEFYPIIKKKVTEAPMKLRCGLAKGNIFSVGNGNDYVGPCINFASRLQKLPGINFVFASRGFNIEENWKASDLTRWEVKKVKVRGIGDSELIYIPKSNFIGMTNEEKKQYIDP